MMTHTVLGVFENREAAEDAINHLKEDGYNAKDISIIMKNKEEGERLAENTDANIAGGAVSGATTGALLGGLAGLVAAFMIPGLGAFFIGGPIAAALGLTGAAATTASGAATGAVAGGLIGALTNLGLSREEAEKYENHLKEGRILVAVPAKNDRVDEVKDIMEDFDAEDIQTVAHKEDHKMSYTGHSHKDIDRRHARGQHHHR